MDQRNHGCGATGYRGCIESKTPHPWWVYTAVHGAASFLFEAGEKFLFQNLGQRQNFLCASYLWPRDILRPIDVERNWLKSF
jgi:hypothetical protein